MVVRIGLLAAVAALALLAFFSAGDTQKADAAVRPVCHFSTPLLQLIQQGGGPDSVKCTFTIRGTEHSLAIDFTLTLGARPPLTIDSCILDLTTAIHRGPCP